MQHPDPSAGLQQGITFAPGVSRERRIGCVGWARGKRQANTVNGREKDEHDMRAKRRTVDLVGRYGAAFASHRQQTAGKHASLCLTSVNKRSSCPLVAVLTEEEKKKKQT